MLNESDVDYVNISSSNVDFCFLSLYSVIFVDKSSDLVYKLPLVRNNLSTFVLDQWQDVSAISRMFWIAK